MQRTPRRLLILVVCTLSLLLAQWGGLLHQLEHVAPTVGVTASTAADGDVDTGGDLLPHSCATCLAFAGLIAAPGASPPATSVFECAPSLRAIESVAHFSAHPVAHYAARAPPAAKAQPLS